MAILEQRPIGRGDFSIPILTLGTWGLAEPAYGPVDEARFDATVSAAIDAGVRSFDVAPLWGDGLAERVVGRHLRDAREEHTIITRVGAERKGAGVVRSLDPDYVRASFEASCDRLGTSYVDVLLVHEPLEKWLLDGRFAKVLAGLEREGHVRAWGASVSTHEGARLALGLGAKVLALPYHLFATDLLAELEADIELHRATVLARSPLLHGLLTNGWAKGGSFPPDDHRSERWSEHALAVRRKHASALSFLVHDEVPSLGAAALRFCTSNPYVSSVLLGARSPEQIRAAVAWLEPTTRLPDEDLERLPQVLAAAGA